LIGQIGYRLPTVSASVDADIGKAFGEAKLNDGPQIILIFHHQ
jgi:hypothetical protein